MATGILPSPQTDRTFNDKKNIINPLLAISKTKFLVLIVDFKVPLSEMSK